MAPHSVKKIHLGKDNDEKWTVLQASVQTHIYYKEKDPEGQEKMTEMGVGCIIGK